MKFNFWLELPTAMSSLLNFDLSEDDQNLSKYLHNTSKTNEILANKILNEIEILEINGIHFNFKKKIQILKEKLNVIEKEKSIILMNAMKFSIKLTSKFISELSHANLTDNLTLTKIKYFLTLIKNCLFQLNIHLDSKKGTLIFNNEQDSELNFCYMMKIFFEKTEAKLFNISMSYLNLSISNFNSKKTAFTLVSKEHTPFSTPQMKLLRIDD